MLPGMHPDDEVPWYIAALFVLMMLAGAAAFVIAIGLKLGLWR